MAEDVLNTPGNRQKTGNRTSFKKGQSGNPSGRPKQTAEEKDALRSIRELAPEAVNVLRGILRSKKTSAAIRLKAVNAILDRTYGKPEANVNLETRLDQKRLEGEAARKFLDMLTDEQLYEYEKLMEEYETQPSPKQSKRPDTPF